MEGIKNSIIKNEYVEFISNERMVVCNECPSLDKEGNHCVVPGTNPCCEVCGCSLGYKTRALSSSCPENKWTAVISVEDEEKLNEMK